MCSDYEQRVRYDEYCRAMHNLVLGIPVHQTERDIPLADDVKVGDRASVVRTVGDNVVELAQMRFGFPPARLRGPIFNFRSQGRHFGDHRRCLIPATAFFELTGKKYRMAKLRFTLVDAPFMAIAGIWRPGRGNQPSAFTMLTTDPGPDVKPFHNRQVVVLRPSDWKAWIELSKTEEELLRPLPAGSLNVETVGKNPDD